MSRAGVLVIGGGTMGRGIAALCALRGIPTALYESDAAARKALKPAIEASWKKAVERGKIDAAAVERALGGLSVPESLEVPQRCDFVLEAVPEDLNLKRQIFTKLDHLSGERTILASNTSSLSITSIAEATERPDRVIGIHFFNPVAVMPLVEIVSGRQTSAATRSRAASLASDLGKTAIHVADSPGFATSRLGVTLGLEAMRMVEEGVASPEDIDRAMELGYGHKMGPLKTSDIVGLDVRLSIAETLAGQLGRERFEPPQILRRLVAQGHTGKKAGVGFYRWKGEEPVSDETEERIKP
jgi:3-hydroxybutyryl-CoA dehydrogenase